jgi:hypothetical protein
MELALQTWPGNKKHIGEVWNVPPALLVGLTDDMAIELSAGKTDRDLLVEIVTVLNRMTLDLHESSTNMEPRIRALENFRWWILGASAALSFAGGLLGHLFWR